MPLETVSYTRRSLDNLTTTTYTDVTAFRSAITGSMSSAGGTAKASQDECRYHLLATTLAVRPRRGDRIASLTEGTWEVMSDDVLTLATRYVARCKKVGS